MTRKNSTRRRVDARAHRLLGGLVLEFRRILKRHATETYRRFPKAKRPCSTCAFSPSTDRWEGNEHTAWLLWQAIEKGEPFYCHEGMEIVDGEYDPATLTQPLKLCGGYGVIVGQTETKSALLEAARRAFS